MNKNVLVKILFFCTALMISKKSFGLAKVYYDLDLYTYKSTRVDNEIVSKLKLFKILITEKEELVFQIKYSLILNLINNNKKNLSPEQLKYDNSDSIEQVTITLEKEFYTISTGRGYVNQGG